MPCFDCKTIEQLEEELLHGQKLQGPPTAAEVNVVLKSKDMEHKYDVLICWWSTQVLWHVLMYIVQPLQQYP